MLFFATQTLYLQVEVLRFLFDTVPYFIRTLTVHFMDMLFPAPFQNLFLFLVVALKSCTTNTKFGFNFILLQPSYYIFQCHY